MKNLALFLFLITQAFAVPLPQDPNDDAEVFSGPINSNAGDDDYDYFGSFVPRVRVFLIPSRPAPDDYYYDYPDLVQQRPSFDSLFNIVKSFLGARPSNKTESDKKCFLCSIFKDSFDNVQDHINNVRDRENEVDLDGALDEVLDVNNSTFTTKVLEDGSVVHINKTTISDVDEDGNSFFFHRAVIHNIGTPDEASDEAADVDNADDDEFEYPSSVENNERSPTTIEETGVDAGLLDI